MTRGRPRTTPDQRLVALCSAWVDLLGAREDETTRQRFTHAWRKAEAAHLLDVPDHQHLDAIQAARERRAMRPRPGRPLTLRQLVEDQRTKRAILAALPEYPDWYSLSVALGLPWSTVMDRLDRLGIDHSVSPQELAEISRIFGKGFPIRSD